MSHERRGGAEPAGLSDLDVYFARLIGRVGGDDSEVALAAALVSQATGRGHICLDLAQVAEKPVGEDGDAGLVAPPLDAWLAALRRSPAVARPGDFAPLVLDDAGRLYLYRYWAYEREVADNLTGRLAEEPDDVNPATLRAGLDRLFPQQPGYGGQRIAAAAAVLRRFTVISGGPGTGKTTTVIRLLALLAEQAAGTPFRVSLAAPTGKAAARMQEVIRAAKHALPVEASIRDAIPEEAATIHRLLGWRPAGGFRHGRDNPLALDVLVVDEASMVDLGLMAKLLRALPPRARVVLVGDRDQLASVAAGAVLGDICAGTPGRSAAFRARLRAATGDDPGGDGVGPPIRDAIVLLTQSYRFAAGSGIGQAARLVNEGDGRGARAILTSADFPDVGWRIVESPRQLAQALAETAPAAFGGVSAEPEAALASFDRLRILCARRGGPFGVDAVNRVVEDRLHAAGCLPRLGLWYPGRPVLVTANDYHLRLFNGDLGVTLPDPEAEGRLRVVYRGSKGELRRFAPARLPAHETAYATTVHRSQGTEAERVILILPGTPSPVLTRELLYTAITRARAQVEVWGTPDVFDAGVAQRIVRSSGLRDALWGAGG
jgi:exodeoxyribonuclease V alpha subunit